MKCLVNMERLWFLMFNLDLGYLTFKLAFGSFDTWQAKYGSDVAIAAVDNKPKRKELYPAYKQYRNVGKEEVIQMVWQLRKQIETDAVLPLCSIDGLEADDLVACWNLFNPKDKIVGVDKDFFQLPNVEYVYYHNMQPYSVIAAIGNLPQYVQTLASRNFALYQILLGDVADNIPRLLAKGKLGKEQIEEALQADDNGDLETYLLKTFGNQAKINAGLVLLPYFEFGEFHEDFTDWFDCWCAGHYYDTWNWSKLHTQMKRCQLPNTVTKDVEVWEMFSLV